jgi:hypothetical protein
MLPQSQVAGGESQLKPLSATADLDLALADLIGDLAAYRPGGKVVILEGGGDSDFDQKVVATLFPEIAEHANLISGTNKTRVESLHRVLEAASDKGQVPYKFYSVTDRDSDTQARPASANSFSWDVYHIENYFLVPKYIAKVLSAVNTSAQLEEDVIWDQLRTLAKDTMPKLVRNELSDFANDQLVRAIDVKTDPRLEDQAPALVDSIDRSFKRLIALQTSTLTKDTLAKKEKEIKERYVESIADGRWVNVFRGRDVLKRFVGKNVNSVSYEVFRNLVLAQMKDDGYRPPGMKDILDRIISAQ